MRGPLILSAVVLAVMALPVQAQDGAMLFARLDQDGNGQINQAEIIAQRTEQFARFDLNGDGAIDQVELEQLQQAIEDAATTGRILSQRQFRQLDTDGNGLVTLSEMQVPGRAFGFADRDGDGVVSAAEFEALAGMLGGG